MGVAKPGGLIRRWEPPNPGSLEKGAPKPGEQGVGAPKPGELKGWESHTRKH